MEPQQDEYLVRFIFGKKDFYKAKPFAKPKAFSPKNGETSVFIISRMSAGEYFITGLSVQKERGKDIRSSATIPVKIFVEKLIEGLYLKLSEPPNHHVNILGWNSDRTAEMQQLVDIAFNATIINGSCKEFASKTP